MIVNVASDAAKSATPGETSSARGMAAIVMFSRALAMEAKRDGIRVNALTPSLIAGTTTGERAMEGVRGSFREGRRRPTSGRRARTTSPG